MNSSTLLPKLKEADILPSGAWRANRHGFSNSCTSCSHSPVIALLNQRCALISGSPE
jgi:hypothetical protein